MSRFRLRLPSLWSQSSFRTFWVGQSISLFGSHVTTLALPLTAIVILHASPIQVGLLGAAGAAATVVFGLGAGVWVDRTRRRPTMIVANVGQGLVLLTIPLAAWLGVLSLPQLYIISFLAASLGVFFNVARRAYLPSLVPRKDLVAANSAMRVSSSAAQIAGPSIGGVLVQILTAPVAVIVDAVSFLTSAVSLWMMRVPEPALEKQQGSGIRREIVEGLDVIRNSPLLRSLAGGSATFILFDSMLFAVYVLYMTRTLHLTASAIGLVFGLAGIAGLIGALLVSPLTARLGVGQAVLWGILIATAGELAIAGAGGPPIAAILILLGAEGAVELGTALYAVNVGSLQQAMTPNHLRGRVGAGTDLLTLGVEPLGAVVGGILGQTVGLRQTVIVAGVGSLLSLVWFVRSPIRGLQSVPKLS